MPNLILLAMSMPEMDGFDVARSLREDPSCRDIAILAATALAMPGDRERCLAAGCDDYLSKPFTHRELQEHVTPLIKQVRDRVSKSKGPGAGDQGPARKP